MGTTFGRSRRPAHAGDSADQATAAVPTAAVPTAADVTVVICTRDRPSMLADALRALRPAVPAGVEILVVDSASSTGETRQVAQTAGVRYTRSDVPGLSIARNLGLREARRPIVVFTDDDCALERGFLPPLIAPFVDARVGAATGLLRDELDEREPSGDPAVTLRRTNEGLDAGHGALMAFRTESMISVGGFDPILGAGRRFGGAEDLDAMCRLLHAGAHVVRVPASVVRHLNTRDDDDYVALNSNYGRGLGAMCAKWVRDGGWAGVALSMRVARRAAVRYARRIRERRHRQGQAALIGGIVQGAREARRIPVRGLVFADQTPPVAAIAPDDPIASPQRSGAVRAAAGGSAHEGLEATL